MKKIFLVGHTGSQNRGCEAIVRSTVKLLKQIGYDQIVLATKDDRFDLKLGLDQLCEVKHTNQTPKNLLQHAVCAAERMLFHGYAYNEQYLQKCIFDEVNTGDYVFVIGGDTYCYADPPTGAYASNRMAHARGARTVLWACTLETSKIDAPMRKDLEIYDYIVPREKITYDLLMSLHLSHPKIILCSDPAFWLDPLTTDAYQLKKGAYVGINISPIALKNTLSRNNIVRCIRDILDRTDVHVLLIPHVYTDHNLDFDALHQVSDVIKNQDRLTLIDQCLSCEQLKFYISQCDAFIGCRTHSTIAAYSTCVPTLVIGYSAKSTGIANDLFGTDQGYVLMSKDFAQEDELSCAFFALWDNREKVKEKLEHIIPAYKKKSQDALACILSK